jgi:hypothetical protein
MIVDVVVTDCQDVTMSLSSLLGNSRGSQQIYELRQTHLFSCRDTTIPSTSAILDRNENTEQSHRLLNTRQPPARSQWSTSLDRFTNLTALFPPMLVKGSRIYILTF